LQVLVEPLDCDYRLRLIVGLGCLASHPISPSAGPVWACRAAWEEIKALLYGMSSDALYIFHCPKSQAKKDPPRRA
jgi:hypothetical protein